MGVTFWRARRVRQQSEPRQRYSKLKRWKWVRRLRCTILVTVVWREGQNASFFGCRWCVWLARNVTFEHSKDLPSANVPVSEEQPSGEALTSRLRNLTSSDSHSVKRPTHVPGPSPQSPNQPTVIISVIWKISHLTTNSNERRPSSTTDPPEDCSHRLVRISCSLQLHHHAVGRSAGEAGRSIQG
jgi:hypothetical protein